MIGLIMGPQGCGKGTQAEFIERDFGFKPESMGNLLKVERNSGTDQGEMIKKVQQEGGLVPPEITNILATKAISEHEKILFDGYPRSFEQLDFLIEKKYEITFAIVIGLSEEESVERLSKRRICTATEKIFAADKITQEEIDACTAKGGEIIQRDDDKPESIKTRLSIYHEKTEPVIEKLIKIGVPVFRIDGAQAIDDVYKDIKKAIDSIFDKYFVEN